MDLQFWNCCKPPIKGYAGTAILVSEKFGAPRPLNVTYDLGKKSHDEEGRVLTAEFEKFILVSVYSPNSGKGGELGRLDYRVNEFDADLHRHCKNMETLKGKPVILSGDLNVAHNEMDIYKTKGMEFCPCFTIEERTSFGNFLKNYKFVDTFRHLNPTTIKYSFFTNRTNAKEKNNGWRLDYFVVSESMVSSV